MNRLPKNSMLIAFRGEHSIERREYIYHRALEGFCAPQISKIHINESSCLFSTCDEDSFEISAGAFCLLPGTNVIHRHGAMCAAADVLQGYSKGGLSFIEELEPPFVAMTASNGDAFVFPDRLGLAHVFYWADGNIAAVSTSSALIARTFGLEHEKSGIFDHMIIGHGFGDRTPFSGVSKIKPGSYLKIANGHISVIAYTPLKLEKPDNVDWIKQGQSAVRAGVGRCLSSVPDCGIELSGGLDSRLALCAIPKVQRRAMTAYTIGYPGDADVTIARAIAKDSNMNFEFIDMSKHAKESYEEVWARVKRISYRDDFSTNVIDRLAIDCIDDQLLSVSRIGGVNGEFARGFYYPMLDIEASAKNGNVDTFLKWRLLTNDSAPASLFDSELRQQYLDDIRQQVVEDFSSFQGLFGYALDEFYLHQRMRHWAGASISRAMMNRAVLAPFFHSEYISWARSLPVTQKRDSRAYCQVLSALDHELAAMPLDSLLRPINLAENGFTSRSRNLLIKVQKIAKKIESRFIAKSANQLGANHFRNKICNAQTLEQLDWHGFSKLGLFSEQGLEDLRSGRIASDRTTIGYLLSLNFQLEFLGSDLTKSKITVREYQCD